jgi:excisionase family DNA binding protein
MESLGIGRTLLRRLVAEHKIVSTYVGRRLLFHVDEVQRFADELHAHARDDAAMRMLDGAGQQGGN